MESAPVELAVFHGHALEQLAGTLTIACCHAPALGDIEKYEGFVRALCGALVDAGDDLCRGSGSKKEVESYRLIAEDSGHSPERILFVSDIVEELDAAKKAGMNTLLSVRPGNAPVDPAGWHSEVSSFDAIRIS